MTKRFASLFAASWMLLAAASYAQEGPNFTLQKFHDALLSHGTPPIKLLRELLLTNPSQDL